MTQNDRDRFAIDPIDRKTVAIVLFPRTVHFYVEAT
jgi:hypothetical protein